MNGAGVRSRSGVGGGLTMSGAMTVWTRYQNSLVLTYLSLLSLIEETCVTSLNLHEFVGLQTHPSANSLSFIEEACVTLLTLHAFVGLQTHPLANSMVERLLVQLLRLCEVSTVHTFHIEKTHSNLHLPHAGMPQRAGREHLPRHLSPGAGFLFQTSLLSCFETTHPTYREHILMSTEDISFRRRLYRETHPTYTEHILICTEHTSRTRFRSQTASWATRTRRVGDCSTILGRRAAWKKYIMASALERRKGTPF